jgi:hypothetical protein
MVRRLKLKYWDTELTREIKAAAKFQRHLSLVPKLRNLGDWLLELERICWNLGSCMLRRFNAYSRISWNIYQGL